LLGIISVGFDVIDKVQIMLFCIPQTQEKKWEYNYAVQQVLIDPTKAYEAVTKEVL
jgi:hypothetical protein